MRTYRTVYLFVLSFLFIFLPPCGIADIYKWVDNKGIVHFGQVPPHGAQPTSRVESLPENAQPQLLESTDSVNVSQKGSHVLKAPVIQRHKDEPVVTETAVVELYGTSWCPYCKKAKAFFLKRGIPFAEYDVEADAEAAQRKQAIDNSPGVPLVVINGQPIHGFSPAAYERALLLVP